MAGSKRRKRGRGRGRRGDNGGGNGRDEPCSAGGRRQVDEICQLRPFSVFCALHLGITENDGYREPHCGAVARRFGLSPEELDDYVREHRLTLDDLRESDFDLEGARLDIQVAPEGISRVELARTMFQEVAPCDNGDTADADSADSDPIAASERQ